MPLEVFLRAVSIAKKGSLFLFKSLRRRYLERLAARCRVAYAMFLLP